MRVTVAGRQVPKEWGVSSLPQIHSDENRKEWTMRDASVGWDSPAKANFILEIAKLIIGIWVGWWLWHLGDAATKRRNEEIRRHDKQAAIDAQIKERVAQRFKLWEKVSPGMNDIYCYFLRVGSWKELDGQKVLARKREIDSVMYSNQIMWSVGFFRAYEEFMGEAFKTFRGSGLDAALRTSLEKRTESKIPSIDFTNEDRSQEVFGAYWAFLNAASPELHVDLPEHMSFEELKRRKAGQ
jgi:hypothetical protein